MATEDLDAQFDAVSNRFEEAKTALGGPTKVNKWEWIWRALIVIGVVITSVFAGFVLNELSRVQAQDTALLQAHSNEIQTIETTLKTLHGSTYPVVVNICEHTAGCVVPPNSKG